MFHSGRYDVGIVSAAQSPFVPHSFRTNEPLCSNRPEPTAERRRGRRAGLPSASANRRGPVMLRLALDLSYTEKPTQRVPAGAGILVHLLESLACALIEELLMLGASLYAAAAVAWFG